MKLEKAWLFAAAFGVVAVHFIGCSDEPKPNPTGSSSGTGGGGNGGDGGSAGNGGGSTSSSSGMPECTTADDCKNNGPVDFCGAPDCSNGKCSRKGLQAPGTALPSQLYGDCQKKQCDSSFNIETVSDDKDVYDDAKECTSDVCTGGVLTHEPVAQGTICAQPNGSQGICDGNGACVTCIDGVQGCTGSFTCKMNACINMKCTNGTKDPGESDIDCGATGCPTCADGKMCVNGGQCASGVCVASICSIPSCMDLVKNGSETDYDCGGPDCGKCQANAGCSTPNDCQSGVCQAGVCIEPKCTDALQNGDEMGVDCGGSCPDPCP